MKTRHGVLGVLILCMSLVALQGGVGFAAADNGYEITIDDATETPSRTVEAEGDEYEIDAIAIREPGDEVATDITLPDDATPVGPGGIYVDLINSDRNAESSVRLFDEDIDDQNEAEATFDLPSDISPGTYSVVVPANDIQDVHPVVVSGYDISVDHPDDIAADATVEVDIDVEEDELSGEPAGGVEAVIWNDNEAETVSADGSIEDGYTASVSADELTTGDDYEVYAVARGDDEFQGENEIIGIGEGSSLTITEAEESDETDPDDSDNDADSGGGGGSSGGQAGGGGGSTGLSPTASISTDIGDEAPGEPGNTVTFSDSAVRSITFDESVSGTVEVEEYDSPPNAPSMGDRPAMASVVITPPAEHADKQATFEVTVDQTEVLRADAEAEDLAVLKAVDTGYETLETDVVDANGDVTLEATTPGFSVFVVSTDEGDITADDGTTGSDESTPAPNMDPGTATPDDGVITPNTEQTASPSVEEQPLSFGVIGAAFAVMLAIQFLYRKD
jgi:hypothetical protein